MSTWLMPRSRRRCAATDGIKLASSAGGVYSIPPFIFSSSANRRLRHRRLSVPARTRPRDPVVSRHFLHPPSTFSPSSLARAANDFFRCGSTEPRGYPIGFGTPHCHRPGFILLLQSQHNTMDGVLGSPIINSKSGPSQVEPNPNKTRNDKIPITKPNPCSPSNLGGHRT